MLARPPHAIVRCKRSICPPWCTAPAARLSTRFGSGALPERLDANHTGALQLGVLLRAEPEQIAIDVLVVLAEARRGRAQWPRRRREPPGRGDEAVRFANLGRYEVFPPAAGVELRVGQKLQTREHRAGRHAVALQ